MLNQNVHTHVLTWVTKTEREETFLEKIAMSSAVFSHSCASVAP